MYLSVLDIVSILILVTSLTTSFCIYAFVIDSTTNNPTVNCEIDILFNQGHSYFIHSSTLNLYDLLNCIIWRLEDIE